MTSNDVRYLILIINHHGHQEAAQTQPMIEMQSLTFSILVILAILSLADCEILRLECETYANFSVIHENRQQIGATVRILLATDGLTCKLECSREPQCKSINVNDYEEICELNDKSAMDPIDRVVITSSTGWIFYSPSYDEQLVSLHCIIPPVLVLQRRN